MTKAHTHPVRLCIWDHGAIVFIRKYLDLPGNIIVLHTRVDSVQLCCCTQSRQQAVVLYTK